MSLNVPLSVRLQTPKSDRHVTRDLHNLTFRSTAPGGFASASFSLSRPLVIAPEEIAEYGKVVVYDRRNGGTVWEGRIEDPGRSAGNNGPVWSITATGPAVYAEDRTTALIYADRRTEGWRVGIDSIASVDVTVNDESVKMSVANGTTHNAGFAGLAVYHPIAYTGHQLGRVHVPWTAGLTSSNYEVWLGTSLGTGATDNHDIQQVTSTSGTLVCSRGGSNAITAGNDTVRLRFVRQTSAFTPTNDTDWVSFSPIVMGLLVDADGNDITSGYNNNYVYAEDVVRDLLGRLLGETYDGPGASVAETFAQIDQLAYPDGASARQVLEDLMLIEPAYYWAAWETLDTGKHRFEWVEWETSVRYDASTADGFDSPAVSGEVYNAVSVRWRDGNGTSRVFRQTQSVLTLDNAGLTREAFIDVSDEAGSAANATQIAGQFLAEHQEPLNQGTLNISRPILDLHTGRAAQPWEIRPGHLIRVRDVFPRLDALNASKRDGVTVFKVAAVDFDSSSATATLELDSYPLTISRAIAELSKRRITRKR